MRVVICGAGHVGGHAAEVLAAADHSITVIDRDESRVRLISDRLDVATMARDCTHAETLIEAGCVKADLLVAATESDEVNLLTASIAKGLGARKTVARVHEGTFYEQATFRYDEHLGIDSLICPEFATAESIAHVLRNPAAIAIESFARWQIEMQEFRVDEKAPAIGKPLMDLSLRGARMAAITQGGEVRTPTADTTVGPGDAVVLIGDHGSMEKAVRLFGKPKPERRDVVVMGGSPMAEWFCRALRDRAFRIRLFEVDRERAEALASRLDWVTVINADPTTQAVFQEEYLGRADVFVALTDDDERNILGGAWAKSQGIKQAVAVVQRPVYLHLLEHIGIDLAFSPRVTAAREIGRLLDDSPLVSLSSLARGVLDIYRVVVGRDAPVTGAPLKSLTGLRDWTIAAVRHEGQAYVPDGDSRIRAEDTVLIVGPHGEGKKLRELFL